MATAVVPSMPDVFDRAQTSSVDEDTPRLTLGHLLHPEHWELPHWNGPR